IWGEVLASHEFAHIAHLTRASRNTFMRRVWAALPANLGPIALNAPRWVVEGYATYVEGRVTGSGRPHGAWRPAFLREWALEGQLPTYGQLDASPTYGGDEFAYLAGSAYLEWLVQRQGDSSLVYLWRRMTARRTRSPRFAQWADTPTRVPDACATAGFSSGASQPAATERSRQISIYGILIMVACAESRGGRECAIRIRLRTAGRPWRNAVPAAT